MGARVATGTLDNGQPWSNLQLHCCVADPQVTGYAVKVYKVPAKIWQACSAENGGLGVDALVNKRVDLEYDVSGTGKAVCVLMQLVNKG